MKFENVSIASVQHLDAPHRVTSAEIDEQLMPGMERLGMMPGILEGLAGITARRFWDQGVQPSDVAAQAAELAIEQAGIDREVLRVLINTSVCRDYIEPSTASLVHGNLGLPATCDNFDVGSACIAFTTGMEIVGNMIELGQIEYGIVVDGEGSRYLVESTIERLQHESADEQTFRDHFAALTLGSGAVAMVLAHRDRVPDAPRYLGAVKVAATEHNRLCLGQVDYMTTDTSGLLRAGLQVASEAWKAGKEMLVWSNEDVDEVAMHQISRVHTTQLLRTLGIQEDKAHLIFPEFGNIGPAGVPTVLSKARDVGRIEKGDRVVLAAIGSGINSTAAGVLW